MQDTLDSELLQGFLLAGVEISNSMFRFDFAITNTKKSLQFRYFQSKMVT